MGGVPHPRQPADIVDELCAWLSEGKTLRAFCRQPGMPARATVDEWRRKDQEFSSRVARARDIGFDAIADECLQIADDGTNDTYTDEEGRQRTDQDVLGRSKLRVESRLKLLACWDPRRYGQKMQVGGADDLPPVQVDDSERRKRLAEILAVAQTRKTGPVADPSSGMSGNPENPHPS